jgi:hypothetical protein
MSENKEKGGRGRERERELITTTFLLLCVCKYYTVRKIQGKALDIMGRS